MTATFDARTHNGFITVHNPKSEGHRTFRIRTVRDEKSSLHGKRIVCLLTGPDRGTNWQPFAFASEHGVHVWKRFQSKAHGKLGRILADVTAGQEYGLRYLFEGRCRVCNRPLTHPESIDTGIGPVCANR